MRPACLLKNCMKLIDSSIQFSSKLKRQLSFDYSKQILRVYVRFGMSECCVSLINVEFGNVETKKFLMNGRIKTLLSLSKFVLKMWTKVFQIEKLVFLKEKIPMILTGCIMKSTTRDLSMWTSMRIQKLLQCIMGLKFGRQSMRRTALTGVKRLDVRKNKCFTN